MRTCASCPRPTPIFTPSRRREIPPGSAFPPQHHQLHLPPLRERREDIELLAQHFLKAHVARLQQGDHRLRRLRDAGAPGLLLAGQRRELDHAVERGVLMAPGKVIRVPDLGLLAGQAARASRR